MARKPAKNPLKKVQGHPVGFLQWRDAIMSAGGPANATTRLVLIAIALRMNSDKARAWPSQEDIARRTFLSERAVGKHVRIAERMGWILRTKTRREKGRNWFYTVYTPAVPVAVFEKIRGVEPGATSHSTGGTPFLSQVERQRLDGWNQVPTNSSSGIPHLNGSSALASGALKSAFEERERREEPQTSASLLNQASPKTSGSSNPERLAREKPSLHTPAIRDLASKGYGPQQIATFLRTNGCTLNEVQQVLNNQEAPVF